MKHGAGGGMNPGIEKKNLIKEELATLPTHYAGKIIVLNPCAQKQRLRPLPPEHEPSLGRHLRLVYRLIDIPRLVSLHPPTPLSPFFCVMHVFHFRVRQWQGVKETAIDGFTKEERNAIKKKRKEKSTTAHPWNGG